MLRRAVDARMQSLIGWLTAAPLRFFPAVAVRITAAPRLITCSPALHRQSWSPLLLRKKCF